MNKSEVAKQTGLDESQVDSFVTKFGNNPYVGAEGRRFKMDQRFGGGGYDVIPRLPEEKEYNFMRMMMGGDLTKPCIIIVGEIHVGGKLKYRDYGIATPANMPSGEAQFYKRGLEIATTRAINRAMGLAIASGFSDPNDIYHPEIAQDPQAVSANSAGGYVPATGSAQVQFLGKMKEYKKKLGDQGYYEVLNSVGYEKSNDTALCSDADEMSSVLAAMMEAEEEFLNPLPEPNIVEEKLLGLDGLSKEEVPAFYDELLDMIKEHPAMTKETTGGKRVIDQFMVKFTEYTLEENWEAINRQFKAAGNMMYPA
jgi:hypothetical protein